MKQTCGKTTVEFSDKCGYSCNCYPEGCTWTIACPDGEGGLFYTHGTGRVENPHPDPHGGVTVAGNLQACAMLLAKRWKRRVTVPPALRAKKLRKRTLRGTPEEIAKALGIVLLPRR